MNHEAKIIWIPAEKYYKLVCRKCGQTLAEGMTDIQAIVFDFPGECDAPDALQVHASEEIGLKDRFGCE